jgi:CHASE domain
MSRWLDRANGLAAYARDTLAAITRWPLRRVLLAGLIGITLSSAAGWAVAHYWEEQTAQDDINDLGENRRLLLQDRLTDLEQTMSIVAARFQDSASEIDHANFARATGEVNNILDKMLEFDWLPRIVDQGHASHERAATGQDLSGDHMSAHGKDGSLVPADAQDEYFPMLYSSLPTVSPHIGMDIGSNPVEREVMTHARDSGRLAATAPAAGPADIFLYAPVYGLDLPHDGVEDRRSTLEGFIRGAFVPGPLIDQIFRGVKSPQDLDIYFFCQDSGPNDPPFHELLAMVPNVQPRGV